MKADVTLRLGIGACQRYWWDRFNVLSGRGCDSGSVLWVRVRVTSAAEGRQCLVAALGSVAGSWPTICECC